MGDGGGPPKHQLGPDPHRGTPNSLALKNKLHSCQLRSASAGLNLRRDFSMSTSLRSASSKGKEDINDIAVNHDMINQDMEPTSRQNQPDLSTTILASVRPTTPRSMLPLLKHLKRSTSSGCGLLLGYGRHLPQRFHPRQATHHFNGYHLLPQNHHE